ncbi:MAG: hypothetical protein J6D08_07370 [Lachnospiraceae bacterium]|nr:hypothetical protein [Lachnospiraceae bacterium]
MLKTFGADSSSQAENDQKIDFYSGFEGEREIVLYADNIELHIWDGYFAPIMNIALDKEIEEYTEAFGVAGQYQTLTGWCGAGAERSIIKFPQKELVVLEKLDIAESLECFQAELSEDYKKDIIQVYKALVDFFKQAEGIVYIEDC